jgi:MoaA/NifB/PqqE/SkfB family radical SAM enzyme
MIDKLPASEIAHINFLGGEPTLLGNKFLRIVKHCSSKGIKTTFNTNGLLLTMSYVKKIVAAGVAGVIVSIDGPDAESHDAVRGKGTFRVIRKNLEALMQFLQKRNISFETTVSTVVTPYNADILGRMVDFCIDLGVESLNILPMSYTGYAVNNVKHLYLSEEQEVEIATKFVLYLKNRPSDLANLRIEPRFILPPLANYLHEKYGYALPLTKNCCSATTTFGYINQLGELFPCDRIAYEYADTDLGIKEGKKSNLLEFEFHEIWNSVFHDSMFQYVTDRSNYERYKPCNRCEYLDAGLCVPCPLFRLRTENPTFFQCIFSEEQLPQALKLSVIHRMDRIEGSHYLNQYQPKRRFIIADGQNLGHGKRVKLTKGVRWNMAPGREIVFNPNTNKFFSLNDLGRQIWNQIDGRKTDAEIVQAIRENATTTSDRPISLEDVRHFLDALASENLLEVC